jgi:hypothetical protein
MSIQDEFREALDIDVLNEIGKSVTLIRKSSPVYNTRGEEVEGSTSQSTITIVPWDLNERTSNQTFGKFIEGSVAMLLRYDQDISDDDLIVMEGQTYKILNINKNYLPDNVATIIQAIKTQPVATSQLVPTTP